MIYPRSQACSEGCIACTPPLHCMKCKKRPYTAASTTLQKTDSQQACFVVSTPVLYQSERQNTTEVAGSQCCMKAPRVTSIATMTTEAIVRHVHQTTLICSGDFRSVLYDLYQQKHMEDLVCTPSRLHSNQHADFATAFQSQKSASKAHHCSLLCSSAAIASCWRCMSSI